MRPIPRLATSDLALIAASLAVECAARSKTAPGEAKWTLEIAAAEALRLKSLISQAVREIVDAEGVA